MTCKLNAMALAVLSLLAACGGSHPPETKPRFQATITRTSYGIPHIEARDEAGLGYGIGYAYAEDNFCLLAGEIVTVNGERSRWFGVEGAGSDNPQQDTNNLESDFFFRQVNDDAIVAQAWQAQPAPVQALVTGYVAGVNRWLAQTGKGALPQQCRNADWVRPITERDVMRLARRIALVGSSLSLIEEIAGAQAPGSGAPPAASRAGHRRLSASNAIAVGADAGGRPLLLGQPHLPWGDTLRFYQLHLTIPGKMDVMGATLPGLPVVGIGFTQGFAWTHTTDTSAHFTVYALQLDERDPTRYIVDGASRPLSARTIAVPVRNADGSVSDRTRTLYSTEHGPLLSLPGLGLEWTRGTAYAIRDANAANHRMLAQWYEMNRATSLADVKAANLRLAGNPWNYTLAVDGQGDTLFMNVSPIPNLPDDVLARCQVVAHAPLAATGLFVLDGSRRACAWRDEPGAAQPGTVPPDRLPLLARRDFVQNANDSAWLSNPAAPLTGFSPLVSRDGVAQGGRTRLALDWLRSRKTAPTAADLRALALDDGIYLAPLLLPDLKAWCAAAGRSGAPCAALSAWRGDAGPDAGMGLQYATAALRPLLEGRADFWAVPFDPADPVATPRGVRWQDPEIDAWLGTAFDGAAAALAQAGIADGARLAEVQVSRRGGATIPIPGAFGELGVFNAIDTEPRDGKLEVVGGTTYVQVVEFDGAGPQAQALLAYSQSSDPASPHHADQTRRFAAKQWITLPFTPAQIAADPALRRQTVGE